MTYATLKYRVGDKRLKHELGFADPRDAYLFLLVKAEQLDEDATDVQALVDSREIVL